MDSSKILEDAEECSSSESGWTMYLASPDHVHDDRVDDDDVDDDVIVFEHKKEDGDVDSDDSMASDASSGPSVQTQRLHVHRGGGAEKTRDEIKCVDKKKYNQHEEKKKNHEQEIEKSRHGANSVGRSSKKM